MKARRLIWYLYPSYILVILVSLVLMYIFSSKAFKAFYLNQTKHDLGAKNVLVEYQIKPLLKEKKIGVLNELLKHQGIQINTRLTVLDKNGNILADSEEIEPELMDLKNRPEVIKALKGEWGVLERYSHAKQTMAIYSAKPVFEQGKVIGVVRSAIPTDQFNVALNNLKKQLIIWGLIICCVSGGVGFLVSRRLSRPIYALTKKLNQVTEESFDVQLEPQSILELKTLGESFQKMSKQLKERVNTILKQAEEKDAILSNMVEGVITVDHMGRIITINEAALQYFMIEYDEVEGRVLQQVIRNVNLQNLVEKARTSSNLIESEFELKLPQEIVLHCHCVSFQDSDKFGKNVLVVLHDITRIRKLEELRTNFVANVSHELKTPVTLIQGFLETLQRGAIDHPAEREEFISIIQTHANRLDAIINDLLHLSRLEQGNNKDGIEMHVEDLDVVIRKSIAACMKKAEKKQIEISTDIMEGCQVSINFSLMEQAVINLIDNAIKYSDSNSQISVSLEKNTQELVVSISDQGNGIPKKHIPHLFERFYRVDKARSREMGGTGLGLAIVKHIIQAHQGRVSVKSEEGKGSTFSIHLPNYFNSPEEEKHV